MTSRRAKAATPRATATATTATSVHQAVGRVDHDDAAAPAVGDPLGYALEERAARFTRSSCARSPLHLVGEHPLDPDEVPDPHDDPADRAARQQHDARGDEREPDRGQAQRATSAATSVQKSGRDRGRTARRRAQPPRRRRAPR